MARDRKGPGRGTAPGGARASPHGPGAAAPTYPSVADAIAAAMPKEDP